jgi:hypothetical protein
MTAKKALKFLMWRLSDIKSDDMPQYLIIRSMVVNEENYAVIRKIKSYLTLSKIDEIFQFYENLREEEKLPTLTALPAPEINPLTNSNHSPGNGEEAA